MPRFHATTHNDRLNGSPLSPPVHTEQGTILRSSSRAPQMISSNFSREWARSSAACRPGRGERSNKGLKEQPATAEPLLTAQVWSHSRSGTRWNV
jgi:hypothetical protein